MDAPRLRLIPTQVSDAERETMLLRTKTMAEIADAASWLGLTFREAYAARAAVWRARYRFL